MPSISKTKNLFNQIKKTIDNTPKADQPKLIEQTFREYFCFFSYKLLGVDNGLDNIYLGFNHDNESQYIPDNLQDISMDFLFGFMYSEYKDSSCLKDSSFLQKLFFYNCLYANIKSVNWLLNNFRSKLDLELYSQTKGTVLFHAVLNQNQKLVGLLIEAGASYENVLKGQSILSVIYKTNFSKSKISPEITKIIDDNSKTYYEKKNVTADKTVSSKEQIISLKNELAIAVDEFNKDLQNHPNNILHRKCQKEELKKIEYSYNQDQFRHCLELIQNIFIFQSSYKPKYWIIGLKIKKFLKGFDLLNNNRALELSMQLFYNDMPQHKFFTDYRIVNSFFLLLAHKNNSALMKFYYKNFSNLINLQFDGCLNISGRCETGTATFLAVKSQKTEAVQCLIDIGVDKNAYVHEGKTIAEYFERNVYMPDFPGLQIFIPNIYRRYIEKLERSNGVSHQFA